MSEHRVTVGWKKGKNDHETYRIGFDGGTEIIASSNPQAQQDNYLDPEQAYVASLSSCHMLSFLAVCAKNGVTVAAYEDNAVGLLGKNKENRIAITKVILNPRIHFSGNNRPTAMQLEQLHESASRNCFIANSVLTEIEIHKEQLELV